MRRLILSAAVPMSLMIAGCAKPQAARTAAAAPAAPAPDPRNKVIVHVVSQHRTITVTSSPRGLLYSLTDPDGRVQIADATEARFAELEPELYRNVKHYIAVHADDAPVASAELDAPVPTPDSAGAVPSATVEGAGRSLDGARRSFRGPMGAVRDDFRRTADQPFPTAREDAPE